MRAPSLLALVLTLAALGCGARSGVDLTSPAPSASTTATSTGSLTAPTKETSTGTPPSCDPTSCKGCCSTSGQCLAGTAPSACGRGGNACVMCPSGVCSGGICGSKVILFGGWDGKTVLSDTWTFNGSSWIRVSVSNPPAGRWQGAMATLGHEVVLFGGQGTTGSPLNDTWIFDGTSWTDVSVSNPPPGRERAAMATLGSEVVFFGGEASSPNLPNDTWTFDGANWSQVPVSGPPPGRVDASMATLP